MTVNIPPHPIILRNSELAKGELHGKFFCDSKIVEIQDIISIALTPAAPCLPS